MRLMSKLVVINASVALAAAALFWFAYQSVLRVGNDYLETAADSLPTMMALQDLRSAAIGISAGLGDLGTLATLGEPGRAALREAEAEQRGRSEAFIAAAAEHGRLVEYLYREGFGDERDRALEIERDGRELVEIGAMFERLVAQQPGPGDLLEARLRLRAASASLLGRIGTALAAEAAELAQYNDRAHATILASRRLVELAAAMTLLLLTGAAFLMARGIVGPVRGLTRAAGLVAAGQPVELPASRSRDEVGVLVNAFRRMADDLWHARRDAEEASQAKSDFLATMSHEIRTPLTSVLGMADLLIAEPLPPRQRRYAEAIRSSGRHLLSVINDILDFSRIEAGKLDLEEIDFAPEDLLEEVQSLMAPQATERGIALEMRGGGAAALPVVRGDPTRLRQVLLNLVGNGIKFTHQGAVAVAASAGPPEDGRIALRFDVRDSGIGIPPEKIGSIFEDFSQADRSTSRRYGGSGLGLAICKRLVEAMGGAIGVESSPDRGSHFWFEVPLRPGNPAAAMGRGGHQPIAVARLRVLVVDDVALNRDVLQEMLARHGHDVRLAVNGEEAVACVEREPPDVVLMDIQMPVLDGVAATRRIRQMPPPLGEVPILALTAHVMTGERERYLAAGMTACLSKPVVWPDLFAALAAVAPGSPGAVAAQAVAAEAAAGETAQDGPEPPLLDRRRLDDLAASLPAGVFRQLLEQGLDEVEGIIAQLDGCADHAEALARAAHKLRGAAGTFGLAAVAAVARRIEDGAGGPEDMAGHVARLQELVLATRPAVEHLLREME